MKRITLLVVALAICFVSEAQDTLSLTGPKGNYLYNDWSTDVGDTIQHNSCRGNQAYYRYTDAPLTVYGIAACLMPSNVYTGSNPDVRIDYPDTALEKVVAILRLYNRTPANTVYQLGVDLTVCLADPPEYYMEMDVVLERGYLDYVQHPVYPVYERYFDNPVEVSDTFYVGMDQNGPHWVSGHYDTRHACLSEFRSINDPVLLNMPNIHYRYGYWQGSPTGWTYNRIYDGYPYIYPILTPLPDTTVMGSDTLLVSGDTVVVRDTLLVGGDTIWVNGEAVVYYDTIVHYDTIIYNLSVSESGLMGRLVGVMPNPATATAKVVSSFGMTMVEAFNMAGEKVHTLRLPDTPLTATLDVRRWPSGTYLLRIHTPQGTAVKKLIVK